MMRRAAMIVLGAAIVTIANGPALGLADRESAQNQSPPTAAPIDTKRILATVQGVPFHGTVLVAQGDRIVFERAFGTVRPGSNAPHRLGQIWRWASITKQVAATIAMQEVAAGRLDLDRPLLTYLPDSPSPFADRITPRMLMQHVSGLRHTDDAPPEIDGWPRFYSAPLNSADTGARWCQGPTDRAPPASFRYGDCDFIVLGAVLEAITHKPFARLVQERIARPLGLRTVGVFPARARTVPGFDGDRPESTAFRIENYGAAGAMFGSTHDMLTFDRALMTGRLLPAAQRGIMWTGKPEYGFAALGQWVFETPIKGCAKDVQIVERRGFIGGIAMRNLIIPDRDMVIIMTSNRSSADATFGEIWQQAGLSHDVLAAALCPAT